MCIQHSFSDLQNENNRDEGIANHGTKDVIDIKLAGESSDYLIKVTLEAYWALDLNSAEHARGFNFNGVG